LPYRTFLLSLSLFALLFVSTLLASTPSADTALSIAKGWIFYGLPLVLLAYAAGIIISCSQIDIFSGVAVSLAGMFVVSWVLAASPASKGTILGGCFVAWTIVIAFYLAMYALIVLLRVPALLCTLGLVFCGQSISLFLNSSVQGVGVYRWHIPMAGIGTQTVPVDGPVRVFGWSIVWVSVAFVLLTMWRYFSRAGLQHIALGMDVGAAEIAGIKVRRVYLTAFLMSGILVGLSALLSLVGVQRGGWAPNIGWGNELLAIAAAVLGGCRITGGRFDPLCISLATLLVFAVRDTVSALPLPVELAPIVLGLSLICVALIDSFDRVVLRAAS
jgi:ribose/xylose/arabinose/galactoside ABC-type transport system permease subunit